MFERITMLGPRQAGILSARVTFLLLLLMFIEPVEVQKQSRVTRELTAPYEDFFKNSLVITPKFTGLDCNFGQDRDCLWTWDADNFTEASSGSAVLPGQNGFYRTNAEEVADFHYASSKNFFGPNSDPNGSKKGRSNSLKIIRQSPIFFLFSLAPFCSGWRIPSHPNPIFSATSLNIHPAMATKPPTLLSPVYVKPIIHKIEHFVVSYYKHGKFCCS